MSLEREEYISLTWSIDEVKEVLKYNDIPINEHNLEVMEDQREEIIYEISLESVYIFRIIVEEVKSHGWFIK